MEQDTVRSQRHSLFLLSRTFLPRKLFSNIKINNQKRSISNREDPLISFTTNVNPKKYTWWAKWESNPHSIAGTRF